MFFGLYEGQLASFLAVVKSQTTAVAKRLAAEGKADQLDQRSESSTNNFLPDKTYGEYRDDEYDPELKPFEKENNLTSALGASGSTHRVDNPPAQLP